MAYEKKDGDIAVFAERDKKNERVPDWKGDALIDGVTYEVALWAKGSNGTMLAGAIKVKQARQGGGGGDTGFRNEGVGGGGQSRVAGGDGHDPFDPDSEIPFLTCMSLR